MQAPARIRRNLLRWCHSAPLVRREKPVTDVLIDLKVHTRYFGLLLAAGTCSRSSEPSPSAPNSCKPLVRRENVFLVSLLSRTSDSNTDPLLNSRTTQKQCKNSTVERGRNNAQARECRRRVVLRRLSARTSCVAEVQHFESALIFKARKRSARGFMTT